MSTLVDVDATTKTLKIELDVKELKSEFKKLGESYRASAPSSGEPNKFSTKTYFSEYLGTEGTPRFPTEPWYCAKKQALHGIISVQGSRIIQQFMERDLLAWKAMAAQNLVQEPVFLAIIASCDAYASGNADTMVLAASIPLYDTASPTTFPADFAAVGLNNFKEVFAAAHEMYLCWLQIMCDGYPDYNVDVDRMRKASILLRAAPDCITDAPFKSKKLENGPSTARAPSTSSVGSLNSDASGAGSIPPLAPVRLAKGKKGRK